MNKHVASHESESLQSPLPSQGAPAADGASASPTDPQDEPRPRKPGAGPPRPEALAPGKSRPANRDAAARAPFVRRPISPRSPLEGRQLWRVGDWGGASEAIGKRWEVLGARALRLEVLGRERPGPDGSFYVPRGAVILGESPELADAVHRHGKTHADALLIGLAGDEAVLEPVDFKWTLETAEPRQVGTEVLEALLESPPALLRQALDAALAEAGVPAEQTPRAQQGIFLAPDHADNRAQLQPHGPMPLELVALSQIEAQEFFPPLPGWDVAVALARQDGAYLGRLETAERYYRIGAGVLGAIRKQRGGLFSDELPELDGPAELAALIRARGLRQIGDLVAYLDRMLIARAELLERMRQVERLGYPYARYRADLTARGLIQDPAQAAQPGERRRWERVYAEVMKGLGRAVRREGRALVAEGRTELETLDELSARAPRFARLARTLLDERLARPQ